MTIRISKDSLLYLFFFLMMATFGIIYMAQSSVLYEKPATHSLPQSEVVSNANTHSATMNGEVLGIVK